MKLIIPLLIVAMLALPAHAVVITNIEYGNYTVDTRGGQGVVFDTNSTVSNDVTGAAIVDDSTTCDPRQEKCDDADDGSSSDGSDRGTDSQDGPVDEPEEPVREEQPDDGPEVELVFDIEGDAEESDGDCDFKLFIDGHAILESVTVNRTFEFGLRLPPRSYLRSLRAVSDDLAVQRALNAVFFKMVGRRSNSCDPVTRDVTVPKQFPAGDYPVRIIAIVISPGERPERIELETIIRLEGKGGLTMLPRDARSIMAARLMEREPVRRDANWEDLNEEDLKRLGITEDDYEEGMMLLMAGKKAAAAALLGDLSPAGEERREMSEDMLDKMDSKLRDKIKSRLGRRGIDPVVEARVFEFEHDGNTLLKSRLVIEVPAEDELQDGSVVVVIPKSVAQSVADIVFENPDFEVIEDDPVVKWAFGAVKKGDTAEVAMTVDGDASGEDVVAIASGVKPSAWTKFWLWIAGMFS